MINTPMTNIPMENSAVIGSPFGQLKIVVNNGQLKKIELDCQEELLAPSDKTALLVSEQLSAYFQSPKHCFDCPILNQGTPFQIKVWQMLNQIPVGEVWTYGLMAKKLGSSARAVGNACRKNPVPIIVPCHRIVSASGLGGFAGQTEGELIRIKKLLLKHEGINIVE